MLKSNFSYIYANLPASALLSWHAFIKSNRKNVLILLEHLGWITCRHVLLAALAAVVLLPAMHSILRVSLRLWSQKAGKEATSLLYRVMQARQPLACQRRSHKYITRTKYEKGNNSIAASKYLTSHDTHNNIESYRETSESAFETQSQSHQELSTPTQEELESYMSTKEPKQKQEQKQKRKSRQREQKQRWRSNLEKKENIVLYQFSPRAKEETANDIIINAENKMVSDRHIDKENITSNSTNELVSEHTHTTNNNNINNNINNLKINISNTNNENNNINRTFLPQLEVKKDERSNITQYLPTQQCSTHSDQLSDNKCKFYFEDGYTNKDKQLEHDKINDAFAYSLARSLTDSARKSIMSFL